MIFVKIGICLFLFTMLVLLPLCKYLSLCHDKLEEDDRLPTTCEVLFAIASPGGMLPILYEYSKNKKAKECGKEHRKVLYFTYFMLALLCVISLFISYMGYV